MTPIDLFIYATQYARRCAARGQGARYPTFYHAARRFRTTLDEVKEAIEAYQGEGYLGAGVALGVSGVGCVAIKNRGDYVVEAYR